MAKTITCDECLESAGKYYLSYRIRRKSIFRLQIGYAVSASDLVIIYSRRSKNGKKKKKAGQISNHE